MGGALVSVVMPCRNAGSMLSGAIRSVLAQTHPDVEFIFVDNGSTDGSADRARSLAAAGRRPFTILSCAEPGPNRARNAGYAHASGQYVQWLDADDALGLEKIALQVAALERDPTIDIAYCDWMASTHGPGGRRQDRTMILRPCDDQIARTLASVWYPPHSYLFRREAADRLQAEQAWWPATKVGDDVEYSAIAAMLGMRFQHVPGARIQYNVWSDSQLSGRGTSYTARTAAMANIYARLRTLAERPDVAPRITPRHRVFLDQDWRVWGMPKGSVEMRPKGLRKVEARHRASGRTILLKAREARVAETLQESGLARATIHLALRIADLAPPLDHDHAFIVATLDRFRRDGLLTAVEPERSEPNL